MNPIYTQLVPELINPLKFVTGSAHPSRPGQAGRGQAGAGQARPGRAGQGRAGLGRAGLKGTDFG